MAATNNKATNWKIGALIGTGTNNQFYEITNLETKKEYGVKVVLKWMLAIIENKGKQLNEIKVLNAIKHNNVVNLYHFF